MNAALLTMGGVLIYKSINERCRFSGWSLFTQLLKTTLMVKVQTLTFDCWTPAGMLTSEQQVPKIIISGSVYDNRYIGH